MLCFDGVKALCDFCASGFPGDRHQSLPRSFKRMTQSVWIFVNIEHGQAFVTGKALSDGVGFIRFERRDFTLFNRGNESAAWLTYSAKRLDGLGHDTPRSVAWLRAVKPLASWNSSRIER